MPVRWVAGESNHKSAGTTWYFRVWQISCPLLTEFPPTNSYVTEWHSSDVHAHWSSMSILYDPPCQITREQRVDSPPTGLVYIQLVLLKHWVSKLWPTSHLKPTRFYPSHMKLSYICPRVVPIPQVLTLTDNDSIFFNFMRQWHQYAAPMMHGLCQ